MLLSIPFPSWLKPEIIPGLPFRWYGLMYIVAFGVAFLAYRRQLRERRFPMSEDELSGLFFWGILGLLLGARIFAAIVYETSDIYRRQPWLVFWPFREGSFTGLMGMSYHGGALGGFLAVLIFSRVKRFNFREIADMYCASIPLGYTFGRLGNFINAELYGRVSTGPLGMIFPNATPLSTGEAWVQDAAARTGTALSGAWVNLPRHPSQLYEALFEGLILWAIIWVFRNRKPFRGFLVGLYFAGYGFFRFFIEYFREPDADLGYRIEFVKSGLSPAYTHPPLSFSTGQILSFGMIVFGIAWIIAASRLPGRETIRVYDTAADASAGKSPADEAGKATKRNQRRKLRKKLR
ncbi:MAG: prolipoprotein diacylglyceryl transferase [Treponema sp.]|jgi:phosphatidylglycerol:prolipoprotein diacylglycerol transferase|nr:prolipoprotein diacylglyceryl transferase [Treponema sp.]